MGELGALFNPGMRHELEERQAKAARREEEGNARDGDLRIDLESGVAVINVPGSEDDPRDEDDATARDDATAQAPTGRVTTDDTSSRVPDNEPARGADRTTASPSLQAAPAPRPRGKRGLSSSTR